MLASKMLKAKSHATKSCRKRFKVQKRICAKKQLKMLRVKWGSSWHGRQLVVGYKNNV